MLHSYFIKLYETKQNKTKRMKFQIAAVGLAAITQIVNASSLGHCHRPLRLFCSAIYIHIYISSFPQRISEGKKIAIDENISQCL